jgi:hypothetical protein
MASKGLRYALAVVAVVAAGALAGVAAAACGAGGASSDAVDAGGDAIDEPFVTAAHPPLPTVKDNGGPRLASPKIVPVFFPGYEQRQVVLDAANGLVTSGYWAAATKEYGVGAVSVMPPIDVAAAPPAHLFDADIHAWLASRFDGTHPEFGTQPIPDAIYTLYYPSTTVIDQADPPDAGGDAGDAGDDEAGLTSYPSCSAFEGYHDEVVIAGQVMTYAVIATCPNAQIGAIDLATTISSHEWIEAATDPRPHSQPAVGGVDDDHWIWGMAQQGAEIADLCNGSDPAKPQYLAFPVSRGWSNAAAKAGTDPCVPPPDAHPYFNALPILAEDVVFPGGGGRTTKGMTLSAGQAKSIDVVLFSTAPTDAWVVGTRVLFLGPDGNFVPSSAMTAALSAQSGANGDKLTLTLQGSAVLSYGIWCVVLGSTLSPADSSARTSLSYAYVLTQP